MNKKAYKKLPIIEPLEPRLLFSAGLEGLLAPELIPPTTAALSSAFLEELVTNTPVTPDTQPAAEVRQELVFVDTDTPDYRQLVDDLLESEQGDRQLEVILLDNTRDGISQISETLASYHNLAAVHLISHGEAGSVDLGGTRLEFDSLLANAKTIQDWGQAFAADGDFLIYGCNLAASADGQSLVDALARLTGADVAASDDLTGSSELGGDWELEYKSGEVDSEFSFSAETQHGWSALLATDITTNSTSSDATVGAANSLTWSHTVNSGSNRILTVGMSLINGQSTNVTYDGKPLTLVGRHSGTHTIEIWQLTAPVVGTANIVANFSGSLEAIGGAAAYNNVNQATPTGTFQGDGGDSSTASVTVSSAPGELVIDTLFVDLNVTATTGADQSEQWNETNGRLGAGSTEDGAASVTMSWDLSPGEEWDIAAVALKPSNNILVNQTTSNGQQDADIALLADGSFITVWKSPNDDNNYDTSGDGVYGRLFNSDGSPAGNEFLINQTTTANQNQPAVISSDNGSFLVAWTSNQSGTSDIYARVFNSSGTPLTNEILVNSDYIAGSQGKPDIAVDDAGNFAVVWSGEGPGDSTGIWGRRMNADGTPNGSSFLAHTATIASEESPAVAMNGSGAFVITWIDKSGASNIALAQRYDSGGTGQGEFTVHAAPGGTEKAPAVAMDDAGNFIIAWEQSGADGSGFGILHRRFSADGTPLDATDQLVNVYSAGGQTEAAIASNNAGDYIITWTSADQDGDVKGIIGQAYTSDGSKAGTEFVINDYITNDQLSSQVAINDAGYIAAVWHGEGADDAQGVYAQLFSPFQVTTTADVADGNTTSISALTSNKGADGLISLREAITAANNTPDSDTIHFNIPLTDNGHVYYQDDGIAGSLSRIAATTLPDASILDFDPDYPAAGYSWYSIQVDSALPQITDEVIIDATSQPGFAGKPIIELNGDGAATGNIAAGRRVQLPWGGDGFDPATLTADGETIMRRSLEWASQTPAPGNLLFVVPDEASLAADDLAKKVLMEDWGYTVNVIDVHDPQAAFDAAVLLNDAVFITENIDSGDLGTKLRDAAIGVVTEEDNLSDEFGMASGIVWDGASTSISIDDNTHYITSPFATGPLPLFTVGQSLAAVNGTLSPDLQSLGSSASGPGLVTLEAGQALYNGSTIDGITIAAGGGGSTLEGLVINRFNQGIFITGGGSNTLQGNYIGTDITGTQDLGNTGNGIEISNSADNLIGGTVVAERNLVSGNNNDGISIWGGGTTGTVIQGNTIGTDVSGTLDLGNTQYGVVVSGSATDNLIGGTGLNEGNRISGNDNHGVVVKDAGTKRNTIRGNSISANTGLGINLTGGTEDANFVTSNDTGDGDTGANDLQNYPILTRAAVSVTSITISGYLDGAADSDFAIDLYASASADPSGYGEGEIYLGSTTITTESSGRGIFHVTLNKVVAAGSSITATATELANGDTSEFSGSFASNAAGNVLWLSTEENVPAPSGVNGLIGEALRSGDVLELGGPALAFEPGVSNGTLSHVANFNEQVVPGNGRINAMHYVGRDMTLAGGVSVQEGDLLLSFFSDETVVNSDTSTLPVSRGDVLLFRPDVFGDYSAGMFSILVDGSDIGLTSILGISLVEQDTVVGTGAGTTNLNAGDFLLVNWHSGATPSAGADPEEIQYFRPTNLGATTTAGTVAVLVDGMDLGLVSGNAFVGIDLVEEDMTIGGANLLSGQILTSTDGNYTLSGTPVDEHDVIILDVTDTGASTVATATVLLEGADVGLNDWQEDLRGLTLVNAPNDAPVAVNDNPGLDFDGIDDYVSIADSASLTMTNTVTMEAWINPDPSANANRMIINKEGEYEVALLPDGTLNWAFANTDPGWTWHNTGYVVPDGEWIHIAVSYNNGTVSTYVNATLIDVYNGSGAIGDAHATLDELRIGGRSNSPAGKCFDGRIDEVRIWNTARTQAEIQAMMDQALTGGEAGLAAYWNFNTGSGTSVADLTANANTGTLIDGGAGTAGPQWTGYSTDQNTQISIAAGSGILSNDIDVDGDTLTVTQVNGSGANVGSLFTLPSGAKLNLDAPGNFIYNPNGAYDFLATGEVVVDTFTYQVDDGNGGTDTATVSIIITGTNDTPVAVADVDATTENAGVTTDVIVNDTDVDATDVLSLQAASVSITSMTNDADSAPVAVVSANVTQSGNDITFNPGTDFDYLATGETATVVIGYTVTDDDGTPLTDAGTLTVTVTGTNDTPVAVADTDSTTENAGVTTDVIVNDTDVDATDVLSLQAASAGITSMTNDADSAPVAVVSANVTQSGNDITFNPGTDFDYLATGETATVVIGYTVTDDDGTPLTDAGTLTVTVTGTNDAPVAVADVDATTENAGVTTDVIANDTPVDATDVLSLEAASASITSMTNDADSAPVAVVSANVTQSGNDITFNPGTDFDYLATGETATVVIGYTVTDDDGTPLTDAGTLTVTVTGTNDTPVAVADTDSTTENAGVTTDVIVNDTAVDATDVLSLQAASASITSMTNDADSAPVAVVSANVTQSGNDITFNPGTDFDYLATGETATVVIGYTVTDDDGTPLTDAGTLTVTVTGTNDAPVAVADTDATTENAGVTTDVITNDTAVDATDVLSLQAASASITSMTNDADSAPVAVLTANATQSGNDITFNPGTDFDYLATGETATVVIGYTVTDDDGTPLTDAGTLTVTVTGTNDAPVAVADLDATTENAGVTTDVIANDTDVDATDVLSLEAASASITSMTNDADSAPVAVVSANVTQSGNDITFNPGTDFDYLATGETATVVIGYTVTDDDGTPLTDAGTLTVTVTGTNDAPVAVADTDATTENAGVTTDVITNDTPVDATDVLNLEAASASITSMTNDADSAPIAVLTANVTQSGNDITFNPGTDFDYLATGETATVVIGYTVTDDDGTPLTDAGTLTVTVTGTNDTPVAVADTDATTENAGVTTDVIANDTDADATDVLSLQATSASITSMTNDADSAPVAVVTANVTQSGNDITFNPGTDFDYLATGETATVVIGYTVTDDDGTPLTDAGTLTVTVTGTNDAPVAVADLDATTENAGVTTDVIVNDTDPDATDVLSLQAASASITSMTNDADSAPVAVLTANVTQSGNDITFNPGTDFDYLATGETATVVIGYTVTDDDGTPFTDAGTLTVTVTGTNDAPVAVADVDATTENAGVTTDVIANDTPVDATDVLSLQAASAGITSMTNDADSAPVAVLTANVTQSGDDITFNPGTDFDYLATGETATVVIGYTVTDDDGTPLTDAGTLTVTVTGTNDAPVAVADTDSTTENAGVTTDVIVNDTDVDATDVLSLQVASASITSMTNDADSAPVAVLTANVTQSGDDITFNPGTDFDYLATGETATVVIGYTVTDDDGTPLTDAGTLTVTVTGTNDAPVAVADTDSTTENAGVTTDVISNDTDVDATDVLSLQAASASITSMTNDADSAPVAVLTANVTQSGNDITFNPGTDFDYLATGETATVVIGYTVTDDDGTPLSDAGTLTVTVTGTNDAPVAVADVDATTENAGVTTDVIANDTPVDATDVLSLQAVSAGITSMTNDADSAPVAVVSANVTQSGNDITFNPGTDFDYLATGETATVVIGYTVTDDDGTPLTDAGTLTVTVTGTNDAPVAVADTDATTENAGVTTDVIVNDTDVDATDVLSLQAASASITSMTNDADSAPVAVVSANVTQSVNDITFNPGTDFDYLATGETATVVIGYTVTDDDGTPLSDAGTLTVTVTGTNDAPVAVADVDATTENAGVTTDVIANDTPVDATDVLSLQAASAGITSMTNDADSAPVAVVSANVTQSGNDITFNPGTDFDYLATGETATVVIGYTVTDDDGTPLTDAGTLTVTVTGTNDTPVAVADTDSTTENAAVTTDVIANDTAVDASDVLSLQAVSVFIDSMTNDADSAPVAVLTANVTQSGNDITFNPGTDFDYLATGETATVVIGYTVTDDDGTPLTDAGTLTVTVTGTNDAPVAVADVDATTENAGVTTDVITNDTDPDATDVLSLQAASASITSMTNDADSAPVAVLTANVTQSGDDITFNPGTDFDYLATGETATVVIGYTVTDDDGTPLTDAGTLTVTVTGTNNAPVAVADTDSTTENAGVTTDVIVNDTDSDATDVLSLQAASASITSMTNDADSAPVAVVSANVTQSGNDITFNPGTDFDYLATGETATVVIGYTVTDDDGTPLTDAGTLTVTVTGTNNAPVAVADTDSTTENAGVTTDVIVNDTDSDATDVLSLQAASASITSMTNDADSAPVAVVSANVTQSGNDITFNPGTDFDYLATGETATVVIGYTVTDDDGTPLTDAGTLTVTVTGTNDAPVAVADTDSTTENAGVTTDVIVNDTDVDATDVLSLQAASASITSMTNDADSAPVAVVSANVTQSGNDITFNPGTDFDYLATGETATVVIGYTVTDDDGTPLTDAGTLTVTVTGTNDAPVAVADTDSTTENAGVTTDVIVNDTDDDATDVLSLQAASAGITSMTNDADSAPVAVVSANVTQSGNDITFNPGTDFDYLATGETATVVIGYTVTDDDGTPLTDAGTLTVTVTSSNDAPVAVADTDATTENAGVTTDVIVNDTDPDATDVLSLEAASAGITSMTNDADSAPVAVVSANVTQSGNDITFNPGTDFDYLATGETATVVIGYTVTDDDGTPLTDAGTLTVTVTGTNDAPVAVADTDSTTENAGVTTDVITNDTDPDATDVLSLQAASVSITSMTNDADSAPVAVVSANVTQSGNDITLNPGTDFDYLATGKTATVVIGYTVTDDDGTPLTDAGTLTVTVTGTNDAPVAVADTDSTTENAGVTTDVIVNDTDPDATDVLSLQAASAGITSMINDADSAPVAVVSANVTQSGNDITFNPGTDFDYLATGETATVVIGYTVTDDDGTPLTDAGTLTVTVTGTNDAPVAVADTDATTENAGVTTDVIANDTPVDATDVLSLQAVSVFIDSMTNDADNTAVTIDTASVSQSDDDITFNPGTDFDYLATGETATVVIGYTVTDDDGTPLTDAGTLTVTVTGTNDAPVAVADTDSTTENAGVTTDVIANDTDPDATDVLSLQAVSVFIDSMTNDADNTAVTIDTASISQSDDDITFNPGTDFDYLATGETATVVIGYTVTDDDGTPLTDAGTLTVTVTGTNDAPVAVDDAGNVDEGAAVTIDVAANDIDLDNALDLGSLTVIDAPEHGTLVVNADGTIEYLHDGSETTADVFTYTIADADGAASNAATVTLSINPVQDILESSPPVEPTPEPEPEPEPEPDPEPEPIAVEAEPTDPTTLKSGTTLSTVTTSLEVSELSASTDTRSDTVDRRFGNSVSRTLNSLIQSTVNTTLEMWQMIDSIRVDMGDLNRKDSPIASLLAKSAGGITLSLSAGVVTWALRGGSLLASMLTSMPLWKGFDPLPVLAASTKQREEEDQDSGEDADNEAIDDFFDQEKRAENHSETETEEDEAKEDDTDEHHNGKSPS